MGKINKEEILKVLKEGGKAKRQTSGVYSEAFKVLDEAMKIAKENGLKQIHRAALTRLIYEDKSLMEKAGLPKQSWYRRCSTLVGHYIDQRGLKKDVDDQGRVVVIVQ